MHRKPNNATTKKKAAQQRARDPFKKYRLGGLVSVKARVMTMLHVRRLFEASVMFLTRDVLMCGRGDKSHR